MGRRQADIFVEVKQFNSSPVNIKGFGEGSEELELRRTSGGYDACLATVPDGAADRSSRLLGGRLCQRILVIKNLQDHFLASFSNYPDHIPQ
jgi:hypothetical protein